MPRRTRRLLPSPGSACSRSLAKPLSGIGQIVQRLRAKQFAGCEELPDAVLRTMAARSENTRESIRYNYFNWKRWVAAQPEGFPPYQAASDGIARYLQDHSPRIIETRNGGFTVDSQPVTPKGERASSLSTLARFLAVMATIHREAGLEDPTKHPEVVQIGNSNGLL